MRRADLERTAQRVGKALGHEHAVLVGGLAVAAHGYLRATEDVDFVTREPLREALARLTGAGVVAKLRPGDVLEGDFPCIKGELDGVPFDVLPPLVELDWSRTARLRVGRWEMKVVDLDGLVRLKLRADGPQDLLDVAMLVALHDEARDGALENARRFRSLDRLQSLLASPRLQVKAAELRARARRARHPRTKSSPRQ